MMRYRILGRTGLRVSEISLGTSKGLVEKLSRQEGERLVARAVDLGVNFIDTARHYGRGEAEARVGAGVRGRRDQVFLCTKCGTLAGGGRDFSRRAILRSMELSLEKLGTDYVDVYLLHMAGPAQLRAAAGGASPEGAGVQPGGLERSGAPLSEDRHQDGKPAAADCEALETLLRLKEEGKARFIGASVDGEMIWRALAIDLFDVLEITYNLADLYPEQGFLDAAGRRGMGLVVKEPLAVANFYRSRPYPAWAAHLWERLQYYDFLKDESEMSAPEVALRFVLSSPQVHTAIPATSNIDHLEFNLGLSDGRKLPKEIAARIRSCYQRAVAEVG